VPSASRIPCIQAFPAGVVGALAVRDGESVLELSQASLDININAGGEPQAAAQADSVTSGSPQPALSRRPGTGRLSRRASDASGPKDPPAHPEWWTCFPAAVSSTSQSPALALRTRSWTRPSALLPSGLVTSCATASGAVPATAIGQEPRASYPSCLSSRSALGPVDRNPAMMACDLALGCHPPGETAGAAGVFCR
jgi:hypothetical protein